MTPTDWALMGHAIRGFHRSVLVDVDDERPPICPACGVTMVPAALSEQEARAEDWICLECEETGQPE